MSNLRSILGVSILFVGIAANAAIVTLKAVDSGWYSDFGQHFEWNPNYAEGFDSNNQLRNFFVFDLSSVVGTISDATLHLNSGAVGGIDTYSLFDVSTDISDIPSN